MPGTIIGGVTTFASSWLTQMTQVRAERLAEQRGRRQGALRVFPNAAIRLGLSPGAAAPEDVVAVQFH